MVTKLPFKGRSGVFVSPAGVKNTELAEGGMRLTKRQLANLGSTLKACLFRDAYCYCCCYLELIRLERVREKRKAL